MSILKSLKQHIPKSKSHRFLLAAMALSLIAILGLSHPIPTYADSSVTADGTKWKTYPGEIYWGGTSQRQALVFYLYNVKGGYVSYEKRPFAFIPSRSAEGEPWTAMAAGMGDYQCRLGRVDAIEYTNTEIPYPATYSEDGSWVSTGGDTKAYLEEELSDGRQRWEEVVASKWTSEFVKKIKKDRGKTYRICIESASALVPYQNVNGQNTQLNYVDGTPMRLMLTNYYMAYEFSHYGIDIRSSTGTGSGKGTANSKWLQSIANGMVFSDPEESKLVGVPIAQGGTVSTSEMYSKGYGFATIKPTIVPIHTFNGTTPSEPEEPKPDITDGECSIYKVYYTQEYDKKGREVGGYKHVYSYSKHQTTNYIVIDSERGYAVEKWLNF